MAAPRRVIALVSDAAQRQQLQEIARSRTGPASGVERARIVLIFGRALGLRGGPRGRGHGPDGQPMS